MHRVHTVYDLCVPFYVNSGNSSSAGRWADLEDSGSLRRNKEERGTLHWRNVMMKRAPETVLVPAAEARERIS